MTATAQTAARIEIPPKLLPVFRARRGGVRYRGAYGGRGSGKSYSFALMAAVFGYSEPLRILATREFQNSIRESFHAEAAAAIRSAPWLEDHYNVGESFIHGRNGTEFIFRGLRRNISAIRSMSDIDLTIIEEAEDVPEESWRQLLPTVLRDDRAEVWALWNPLREGSPVDRRFRHSPPDNAAFAELSWRDNPWFPQALGEQRRDDQSRLDPATYAHVWEGAYLRNSDAQVLAGKVRVLEFEPGEGWHGPYYGLDFGFAQDPTAGVRCWVYDDCLYVEHEAGRSGLELDETAGYLVERVPGISDHVVRSDSARPESISYLRRHGLPRIAAVKKGQGSVEDGIKHLRSYREIVVHPRCEGTIRETRLYSYKVDRLTGDVLPQLVDAHNHYIDALRYALEPMIRPPTRWSLA